jgi:3',5'-cyclic AMP phosphodiesterase CpdA
MAAVSCGGTTAMEYEKNPALGELLDENVGYPAVRFAVFSDTHYHDPSLGSSGKAYTDYLKSDSKMLHLSGEIIDAGMAAIAAENPEFVLVPGDLTKEGSESITSASGTGWRACKTRTDTLRDREPTTSTRMACRYAGDSPDRWKA